MWVATRKPRDSNTYTTLRTTVSAIRFWGLFSIGNMGESRQPPTRYLVILPRNWHWAFCTNWSYFGDLVYTRATKCGITNQCMFKIQGALPHGTVVTTIFKSGCWSRVGKTFVLLLDKVANAISRCRPLQWLRWREIGSARRQSTIMYSRRDILVIPPSSRSKESGAYRNVCE